MELIYICAVLRNFEMRSHDRARMLRSLFTAGGGCGDYFKRDVPLAEIIAHNGKLNLSCIPALQCWN